MRAPIFLSSLLGVALWAGAAFPQTFGFPWKVYALPGTGNFEVIENAGGDNSRFWCAAGNYAVQNLRQGATTRIYITKPYGPAKTRKDRTSVGFTVAPTKEILAVASRSGDGGNYSLSVKRVGYNISVGHARAYCVFDISFP